MHDEVREALRRWAIEPRSVSLAAHRENAVYRVETDTGALALRLHRPGYRSDAELQSELQWMAELERNRLSVPKPVASQNGKLVEDCGQHRVSILTWMPGVPLGNSRAPLNLPDAPATFFAIGREMARLHNICDAWSPPTNFTRHAWNAEGLIGNSPCWGRFWENPGLSRRDQAIIEKVRSRADKILNSGQVLDFGLIHADLLRENILIHGSETTFIDFDDGGFGFRLFELATTLHRNRDEPDYEKLKASLIKGYRSLRNLDTANLELFIALRALTYLGWIIPRMHEPDKRSRNPRLISEAMSACTTFLRDNAEAK